MNAWQYAPAPDLEQPLLERLRRFPREPDMLVYGLRAAAALVCRAWLRAWHRLEITGREHLPAGGSFVMVANHGSHLDALCLLAALPLRQLHRAFPAAAQDYFFVSAPRVALAAVVVNALPLARRAHPGQTVEICRALLANPGNVLILFPEGTRTGTGAIGPFKPGVGLLAAGAPWPVLPCHLDGAFAAWPKGQMWPRPRPVRLRLGPPRTYAHLPPGTRESAEFVARDLRAAVAALQPGV